MSARGKNPPVRLARRLDGSGATALEVGGKASIPRARRAARTLEWHGLRGIFPDSVHAYESGFGKGRHPKR